jgi:hypothetical protein
MFMRSFDKINALGHHYDVVCVGLHVQFLSEAYYSDLD